MIFVDTNVIVAFLTAEHVHHAQAFAAMRSLIDRGDTLAVSPQIFGEAFVVLTSKRCLERPASPAVAREKLQSLMESPLVEVLSPGRIAVETALTTAERCQISSSRFFDLLIYGTMREHGVASILTFNVKDFEPLEQIQVIVPQ